MPAELGVVAFTIGPVTVELPKLKSDETLQQSWHVHQ